MALTSGTVAVAVTMKDSLQPGPTVVTPYAVPLTVNVSTTYGNGTAANQCQKCYQHAGTAAAAPVDIDLTTTANTDGTTGFAFVREVVIVNLGGADGLDLTTGGGTNPFAPYLGGTAPTTTIKAGTARTFSNPLSALGWPVSGGAKTIRLDPGANNVPYQVFIFGT
jgi:hypothetical protein